MSQNMWSQQKRLSLIDDLHRIPCLWDVHSVEYRNSSIKAEALAQLAKKYEVESVEIEKKIQALKSQFRREHKKILDYQKDGSPPKKAIWFGYDRLLFLLPCYESRESRANRLSDTQDMTEDISYKLLFGNDSDGHIEDDIENYSSASGGSNATELQSKEPLDALETVTNNALKRKEFLSPLTTQKKKSFDSSGTEAFKCLTTLTESVFKRDEYSIYGEHVGNKLRNSGRSKLENAIAQNEIDNICFKLAMGGFSELAYSYQQSTRSRRDATEMLPAASLQPSISLQTPPCTNQLPPTNLNAPNISHCM